MQFKTIHIPSKTFAASFFLIAPSVRRVWKFWYTRAKEEMEGSILLLAQTYKKS